MTSARARPVTTDQVPIADQVTEYELLKKQNEELKKRWGTPGLCSYAVRQGKTSTVYLLR